MEEIRKMLDEEIKLQINELASMKSGSDEKSAAIDDLAKLYRLKIEENKTKLEFEDRAEERFTENAKAAEDLKDKYIRLGLDTARLLLPLMFYAALFKKGLKFEETGTFTSTTFRGLIGYIKPTLK